MATTRETSRLEVFDTTLHKTHAWINDLREELGAENDHQAYAALRAVLHALRDRLTIDETAHLAAQMPMLVRGMFYEGWKPALVPVKSRNREEFLNQVQAHFRGPPFLNPEQITRGVLALLDRYITRGEINDVKSMMPSDVSDLWPE